MYSHAVSDNDIQRSKAAHANSGASQKTEEAASLPATVSWASKNALANQPTQPIVLNPSLPPLSAAAKPKQINVSKPQNHPLPPRPNSRTASSGRPASPASKTTGSGSRESSRPATPALIDTARRASTSLPAQPPSPQAVKPVSNGIVNGNHRQGDDEASLQALPGLDFGSDGVFNFSLNLSDVKGKSKAPNGPSATQNSIDQLEGIPSIFASTTPTASTAPGYIGSFDPFAEVNSDSRPASASSSPPENAARRGSRFEFARRTSHGTKAPEIARHNALAALLGTGDSNPSTPFAPPGLALNRPPSSASFSFSQTSDRDSTRSGDSTSLWGASAATASTLPPTSYEGGLPPGLVRSLASPDASKHSSPSVSPGPRPPYGQSVPPGLTPNTGGSGAAGSLPPGLAINRGPSIGAASFPLPPPAPKASNQPQQGTTVGKDELLALIAAAQKQSSSSASSKAVSPAPPSNHSNLLESQQQQQQQNPFFSDPAILNARLGGAVSGGSFNLTPASTGGSGTAFLSLDSLAPASQAYRGPASYSLSPFGPGAGGQALPPRNLGALAGFGSTANSTLPPPPGLRAVGSAQSPFGQPPSSAAPGAPVGVIGQTVHHPAAAQLLRSGNAL